MNAVHWANWARYAQMTDWDLVDRCYRLGHTTRAYNEFTYISTMNYIRIMRAYGREVTLVRFADNHDMLRKLAELGFDTRADDAIECVDDPEIPQDWDGPIPSVDRASRSVFEVSEALQHILNSIAR